MMTHTDSHAMIASADSHTHTDITASAQYQGIVGAFCLSFLLGATLRLWYSTTPKDYPSYFIMALSALPTVAIIYYKRFHSLPEFHSPWLALVIGISLVHIAYKKMRPSPSDPILAPMPTDQAWCVIGILSALSLISPEISVVAFFIFGNIYHVTMKQYWVASSVLASVIVLSSGVLTDLHLIGESLQPITILVSLGFIGLSFISLSILEYFQWRFISLVGLLKMISSLMIIIQNFSL